MGLLNFNQFIKEAEGYGEGYHPDPSKKIKQTNIGFGVKATEEIRKLRDKLLSEGFTPLEANEAILQKSIKDHTERARRKFNKDLNPKYQIPFDKQPPAVQELLTELELNTGNLGGWPTLVERAKSGDYAGVEKEMYLDEEGQGAKRRNDLRREYFSGKLKSQPELTILDAYGTVGEYPSTAKSTWDLIKSTVTDPTMYGFPAHPVDYFKKNWNTLFGSEPSPQQQYEARPRPPLTPPTQYTVQRGDTLSQIAQRLGIPMGDLVRANGISDPNRIQVGQVLNLAPPQQMPTPPVSPTSKLQQQAQLAQVQPTLDPFPWLKETGNYNDPNRPRGSFGIPAKNLSI